MSEDQLMFLHSFSFTWTEIASLLGVSRMMVYRRRQEYGLLDDSLESLVLNDRELNAVLSYLRRTHPPWRKMARVSLNPWAIT